MFKRYGYIFSLLLVFSLHLDAKSLLYKLSSNGSTIYIMGSIHLAKPDLYPLDKKITSAYKRSEFLVVEVDPSSQESLLAMQDTMLSSGIYNKNQSLKTELSAKTYKSLEAYTDKRGIPLELIEKMKPWVVMLQVTITEMMRLGYFPELGIDKHFLDKAKLSKKKIIELETAQQQMALLSKDDKAFQDKLLLYTLESMNELEPMLDEMFNAWKKGDMKAFEKIMTLPLKTDASLQDVYADLITKRNYQMTQRIENFIRSKKDCFVVVGSGHLVGREGIVALLRKRGYQLTQN